MIKSLSMEAIMKAVTVSPKFQVVIPRDLRKSMDIQPGTKVHVLQYENRIELIPLKSPKSLRGFLKGINMKAHDVFQVGYVTSTWMSE
jgi:AbrB family looped-hinge helix DNA binding protein